jgi:hypothetical protein
LPANILPVSDLYCTLLHEQVQASIGALHKAIDHAILFEDQLAQAGHQTDGMAKKHQENVGFVPEATLKPISATADLVFIDN